MANTVQNVLGGSSSIIANDPPPEGKSGCQVTFTIDPTIGFVTQSFQMSNAQGLSLSQVVSLVIDNTQNPCSITVTHGVLQEKIVIAALALQIVPTFSNKGPYPISILLSPGVNSNAVLAIVAVTFLNYNRPAAAIGGSNGQSANAPQAFAGQPVNSGLAQFTSLNQQIELLLNIQNSGGGYPNGAYYIYGIDLTVISAMAIAAGFVNIGIQVQGIGPGGGPPIWELEWEFIASGTGAASVAINQWRYWIMNPTPIFGQMVGGAITPDPSSFIQFQIVRMSNALSVNFCANVQRNLVLSA